jgi:hypothetical protein
MENLELNKLDVTHTEPQPQVKEQRQKSTMARNKRKFPFFKKKHLKVYIGVFAALVALFGFVSYQSYAVYNHARKVETQARVAMDAVKQQNVVLAKEELVKTQAEVLELKKDLDRIGFIGYVPLLGTYVKDAQHMVNAGSHGINAAITTTDSLIPYADVLGLQGGGGFTGGSAQDRIRIAVKTLGKVVPKIDNIEKDLQLAQAEIDQVNPEHYPNFCKFKQLREQITQVRSLADEGVLAVEQGKPLIKVLPQLLGESESKRYLILFQNDKELRPTGGFLTYYAIFKVEEGVISVEKSSNIYDLDDSIRSKPAAPDVLQKYLEVKTLNIRDSNMSPDFVESMKSFNEMYENSSEYEEVDGIIALDTHFLVNVIRILGEVEAAGLKFNSDIDPRCNCPQVVFVLEDQITRPVNYIRENRKALIGELLYAVMQKALSSSPKEYWGRLVQQGMLDAQEKHVLMYLYNEDAQKGITALNWGGTMRESGGDYIHINDANLGGAKSNMFVKQNVRMDYTVEEGKVSKSVKITYRNPEKHSNCNLEAGQLCLNAVLRNWQRLYVPKGSVLKDTKGSEVKVETYTDLNKTVYEGFMRVNPLGKAEITYNYELPFDVKDQETLPVLIQKQPGTEAIPFEIYLNGELVESFDLRADKQLDLAL